MVLLSHLRSAGPRGYRCFCVMLLHHLKLYIALGDELLVPCVLLLELDESLAPETDRLV